MNKKAFTLIEIMIVMGAIAILVTIGIAGIRIAQRSQRNADRKNTVGEIANIINDYKLEQLVYPDTITISTSNVQVGSEQVDLDSHMQYSSSGTSSTATYYEYQKTDTGFTLCAALEGDGVANGGTTEVSSCVP